MTRIRVSGLLALDSLLLTVLSAPELYLTLGHAHSDQARFGPRQTDARKEARRCFGPTTPRRARARARKAPTPSISKLAHVGHQKNKVANSA
jgi:hypothetical protein